MVVLFEWSCFLYLVFVGNMEFYDCFFYLLCFGVYMCIWKFCFFR